MTDDPGQPWTVGEDAPAASSPIALSADASSVHDDLTAAMLLAADSEARLRVGDTGAACQDLGLLQVVICSLSAELGQSPPEAPLARTLLHAHARQTGLALVGECPPVQVGVPEIVLQRVLCLLVNHLAEVGDGQVDLHIGAVTGVCVELHLHAGAHATVVPSEEEDRLLTGLGEILARRGASLHLQRAGDGRPIVALHLPVVGSAYEAR